MQLFHILCAVLLPSVFAAIQSNSASTALNQFAIKLLAKTNSLADEINIALSPYTVWNVMATLNEGARATTAKQLEEVLGIPQNGANRDQFRILQESLTKNILKNHDGITLEILNAIFTMMGKRLNDNYQRLVQNTYNTEIFPVDFNDVTAASRIINKKLATATKGRANDVINGDELRGVQMIVTSALFFKGLWENKFNISDTKEKPFYNEKNQVIGTVPMMYNKATVTFSLVLNDKATAVELPYKGGQMSMIIVLPKPNVPLQSILQMMSEDPFSRILEALRLSEAIFGNTSYVEVYLPKFEINTSLNLNYVLHQMGIQHIFDELYTDLSGISSDNLYLSRIIHKAQIEVDEEGTVATAVTVAELENKTPAPIFNANKPFLFFIFDKQTESIVFTGKYAIPTLRKNN